MGCLLDIAPEHEHAKTAHFHFRHLGDSLIKKLSMLVAAALAGSFLSVVPASAAVPTIAVSINGTAVTTAANAATPATVTVPADNSVDAADAVKFVLTGIDTGTVVSVTAVNAFIIPTLATVSSPATASAGVTGLEIKTGTGTTAEFYVYTKTTAVGAVTIINGGNAFTYYVKGTAGPAYTLTAPAISVANTSSTVNTVLKVTDVFGNAVAGVSIASSTVNVIAGTEGTTAADGTTKANYVFPATAGKAAVAWSITATDVVGLPAAVKNVSFFIDIADLATINAGLAADLAKAKADLEAEKAARVADKKAADDAAAKAKADADKAAADAKAAADKAAADAKALADKALADAKAEIDALKAANAKAIAEMKAAFNSLAKKWNAKNPKAKVALIK